MTPASPLRDRDTSQEPLQQRWEALRRSEPQLRIRDAADRLGVSEAELVEVDPEGSVPLRAPFGPLIEALESLGPVMALTRNAFAVHEKRGTYRNVSVHEHHALVLDEAIDLRLFQNRWAYGFAREHGAPKKVVASLQFFDAHGTAVHKIFLEDAARLGEFRALVARFAEPGRRLHIRPPTPRASARPDAEIDVSKLRAAWDALFDPHDYFAMLRKLDVRRTQALRLVGAPHAVPVATGGIDQVLQVASTTALPIMVFVGSPGAIQIHTGPVNRIQRMGPWLNVLDASFNLHLRTDGVTEAWVVRKPSPEGWVTSLELFDADGELIVQLFGKRKPGTPELPAWRELLASLDGPAGRAR